MKHLKLILKKPVIFSLVLVLFLAGGLWFFAFRGKSQSVKSTNAVVTRGDIDVYIEADGTVNAEKANLSFSQAGTVQTINVKIGESVSIGSALASLDSSKLQFQVEQARGVYNTAVAKASRLKPGSNGEEVVVKQQSLQAAKVALDAERNIYNDVVNKYGLGSSQELAEYSKLKKAESDVASAESQLQLTYATYEDASYAVDTAYANLQIAQTALNEATLKSPMDGVVTAINGAVGQYVSSSSQQTTTPFITISKIDNLVVISNLDEEEISKVKVGQTVKAEFTSLNQTFEGRVEYVSPVSKADSGGAVSYEVRISLYNPVGVIDGMTANLKFITKSVNDVMKIPNNAVKMINGKAYVNYYGDTKEVINKEIVTGFTDGQNVEVVKGLEIGDKIIITSTVTASKE